MSEQTESYLLPLLDRFLVFAEKQNALLCFLYPLYVHKSVGKICVKQQGENNTTQLDFLAHSQHDPRIDRRWL